MTSRRAIAAWVLYDLANTLFSFVVLSSYFGPWATGRLGASDSAVTLPVTISMLVVLVLAPVLGALADRGRKIPFLVASTAVAVAATAGLGAGELLGWSTSATLALAIALFGLANAGFQLGLVFYDALLPVVAPADRVGRVGALGVGVGYFGSFVGLGLGILLVRKGADGVAAGHPTLFVVTAALFLAFALPCFLLVRESRPPRAGKGAIAAAARRVASTLRKLPQEPALARYLVARLLYAETANTVILILGIYLVKEGGISEGEGAYTAILGLGILAAVLAAPLWGLLVDRRGPRRALRVVLLTWAATLVLVIAIPVLSLPTPLFFAVGALIGASLSGTWSADRPLLLGLIPPGTAGEWFGLYAMAGRFAAVVGPALWALTVDVLLAGHPLARPAAVGTFLVFVLAGFVVVGGLPDRRAEPS